MAGPLGKPGDRLNKETSIYMSPFLFQKLPDSSSANFPDGKSRALLKLHLSPLPSPPHLCSFLHTSPSQFPPHLRNPQIFTRPGSGQWRGGGVGGGSVVLSGDGSSESTVMMGSVPVSHLGRGSSGSPANVWMVASPLNRIARIDPSNRFEIFLHPKTPQGEDNPTPERWLGVAN
ncbi:hypothetical protein BDZ91DRAFT_730075 [Kalaharituber pfeilii]|nr:hypothetical protein BDZ91DRAFT_730075 [Kalaharituber pfeilii]